MGWVYEYLGEQLVDEIRERLGCDEDVEFDSKTYVRLYAGYDLPETGYFEGYAFIGEDKRKFLIKYLLRRRMPSNGLDYGFQEPEYECCLLCCDPLFDMRTGEQVKGKDAAGYLYSCLLGISPEVRDVLFWRLVSALESGYVGTDELVDSLLSEIERLQRDCGLLASALKAFKDQKPSHVEVLEFCRNTILHSADELEAESLLDEFNLRGES